MIKQSLKKTITLKPPTLLQEPHVLTSMTRNWDLSPSKSNQLPIYKNYKNGHPIITIRRIKGEIEQLAQELEKFIDRNRIMIRKDLEKIYVKGDYLQAVREFFNKNLKT